jgi:hypothetical protein
VPIDTTAERTANYGGEGSEVVTITLQGGGGPLAPAGVFEDAFSQVPLSDGTLGSTAPSFTCNSDDVPNVAKNDIVDRNGTQYRVMLRRDDGTGVTSLLLEAV